MTARAFARVLASAILIGAQAAPAHATIAYLPLASGDASTADGYRFDGIGVVELPALRPVRQIAIAPATDYITVSPDGRTFTFRLRAGLQWSDGTPLTATDLRLAQDWIVRPQLLRVVTATY